MHFPPILKCSFFMRLLTIVLILAFSWTTMAAGQAPGPSGGKSSNEVKKQLVSSTSISPTTINKGESATLSWNAANASSISIDQGIGAVSASGRVERRVAALAACEGEKEPNHEQL
ncbi:MAG: hypothetical protein NTU60_08260 [Candidatus Aminicenantes bacterium]|nr:hypothetical protein [Candidatus Aminicenantes bacterium]